VTAYGPIVPVTVVEDLMTAKLRERIEDYLAEVARQVGYDGTYSPPKSWGVPQGDYVKRPEQITPALTVLSPGDASEPVPDGDGYYATASQLEVRVAVSANTPDATNRTVKAYATAIAALLVQQPLGAPVEAVDWLGNTYDDLTGDSDRTMLGATVKFTAYSDRVLQRDAGPLAAPNPPSDPSPDDPELETIGIVGQRLI
jgi:hypothetical protein